MVIQVKWPVKQDSPMTIWTDASSVAIGVLLKVDNEIIEDAACLRPKDDLNHINREANWMLPSRE